MDLTPRHRLTYALPFTVEISNPQDVTPRHLRAALLRRIIEMDEASLWGALDAPVVQELPMFDETEGVILTVCGGGGGPLSALPVAQANALLRAYGRRPDSIRHLTPGEWLASCKPVYGGDGAIAAPFGSMTLCVETDGYAHS